ASSSFSPASATKRHYLSKQEKKHRKPIQNPNFIPLQKHPPMPSLAFANNSADSIDRKEKKMKKKIALETPEMEKRKNPKLADLEEEEYSEKKQKKESKKKRKAAEIEQEEGGEDRSETSSELGEPVNLKKKSKKSKVEEENGEGVEAKADDPNAVSKFRISEPLREKLKSKGIESLFPIQARTFDDVLDGCDLVGRARTGQGKTLAFVLPILESLTNGPTKSSRKTGYGRPPSVLVLLPTRELASQVYDDFKVYGSALGLASCCLYGGASYHGQESSLKRGVDIVVGTPGRIKDHIERGNIDLSTLKFRVLDEADEMLRMGFVEDVELILGKVQDVSKVQTLLFSATLPDWVKNISTRFLKPTKKTIDLVGNERMKASTNVRHIVLPCSASAIPQLIPDIIRCYSSGGRTIIFTEKRESANELAGLLPGARALHGDIQQSQREVTLSGFRSGKFMTLVATNVAARGLDINDVQLIIQKHIFIVLDALEEQAILGLRIERESGVKFERIAAPQPADVAKAVGAEAADAITQISDSVIPAFKSAAEDLLSTSGLSAVELLAKALAKASGYTELKSRSLLSSMENYVTVLLEAGKPVYTPSRVLPEDKPCLLCNRENNLGEDLVAVVVEAAVDALVTETVETGSLEEATVATDLVAQRGVTVGANGEGISNFSSKNQSFEIMSFYRRAKLGLDALRTAASKIVPPKAASFAQSASRIYHHGAPNPAKFSGFSSYSTLSQRLGLGSQIGANRVVGHRTPFLGNGGRRFYYVDRYQVHHFRPRGPKRWFSNPRNVFIVVVVGSGVFITVYFGNLETVPYTKRKHFVLLSKSLERKVGEAQFEQMKGAFKGKILPAIHPESIRVRLIAKDIIESLKKGLKQDLVVWRDLGYGSPESHMGDEHSAQETLKALSEREGQVETKWYKEDEILDDTWVEHSRDKGIKQGRRADVSHLDEFKWEVLVVNEPVVNAFCLPGGKIVVFTGLLEQFRTDAEIATILGHEIGHAVARHVAEGITKNLWVAIVQIVLYQFIMPDFANAMSLLFLRLPFSRRMEIEADYIGILLMAAAGYDPRVAPKVFEKLGKLTGDSAIRDYLSTHPSGKKRAELLAQAQVMEEALAIYRETTAGRGIEGFFL
ncbi:hypothetical protein Tsubulata_047955, partial [Turnera subulata]